MNLEQFVQVYLLYYMYSCKCKATHSTRFSFGTSCIFPKICQNKVKILIFLLVFLAKILLSKMAQK